MDNNVLSVLVTILGWAIAAYWVVKQVNIAHKKIKSFRMK